MPAARSPRWPTTTALRAQRRGRRCADGLPHATDGAIDHLRAAPSETAEFAETPLPAADADAAPRRAAAGDRQPADRRAAAHPARAARPRRWSVLVVAGGPRVRPASRRLGQQVAATGQSLMQSQRLAKSVSQALVGSAAGLPRREGKRRRAGAQRARPARPATATCAAAPSAACRTTLEHGRCRWSSAPRRTPRTVIGQQKILTQVGAGAAHHQPPVVRPARDRRDRVRRSSCSRDAAPAEISAAGQLVMLTQRIGKSANEFLTVEGVSPEAVFLLGKDLNSFKEIAQGLLDGSAELRLARHERPADPRAPGRAARSSTSRPARRPAPSWATCRAWWPRAKRRPRSSRDSEPLRRGLETCRTSSARRPASARLTLAAAGAVVAAASIARRRRLCASTCSEQDQRAPLARAAAPRSRAPGAGSQARQRRQPGGHSCG